MIVQTSLTRLSLLAVLLGTASCGMFSKPATGPQKIENLVGWIERVHVDSELAKERALTAVDSLQAIMRAKYEGDALVAYDELVASVEQSERQATELSASVDPMLAASEPVFEQWATDLDAFANPAMRERSEARMNATKTRYDLIVTSVQPAREQLAALNQGLRDHVVFLANDFNPDAVAAIRDEANKLVTLSLQLEKDLNQCLVASRDYIENTSLPMSVTVNATPMTETEGTQKRRASGWAQRPKNETTKSRK